MFFHLVKLHVFHVQVLWFELFDLTQSSMQMLQLKQLFCLRLHTQFPLQIANSCLGALENPSLLNQ